MNRMKESSKGGKQRGGIITVPGTSQRGQDSDDGAGNEEDDSGNQGEIPSLKDRFRTHRPPGD